jgi:hypothetical protein
MYALFRLAERAALALCGAWMSLAGPAALADAPAPGRLLHHIDLSGMAEPSAYVRGTLQFGDLNGDGIVDFLRSTNGGRMQALAYDGVGGVRVLWSLETGVMLPAPSERYHWKYVVADLDGDGRAEVAGPLASTTGIDLVVIDGPSGEVKRRVALPLQHPKSDDANRSLRIKVAVADLSGTGRPTDLIVLSEENSNGDIWAFSRDLTPLWDTTGDNATKRRIYAHFPWARDLDGDGREEIVGAWILGHDGRRRARLTPADWEASDLYYDHIDRAFIGDFRPDLPGLEILYSHEKLFATMAAADGTVIWSKPSTHNDAKIVAVGEFDAANAGVEIAIEDPDAKMMRILDVMGRELRSMPLVPAGYAIDWDGDRTEDELFQSRDGSIIEMRTGRKIELAKLFEEKARTPKPKNMRFYAHALDLLGDAREEIVLADNDEIMIFGAQSAPVPGRPSPWTSPIYARAIANMMNDNHPERDSWFDWRTLPR